MTVVFLRPRLRPSRNTPSTTVFRHQADRALVPASTQKVVVGQVALDRLGADHRFRTRVLGPAPVDGVVTGDVALVGGGDPLLTTATYAFVRRTAEQPLTFLDALADALVAGGVRRVTGRIVADDTRYDALRTIAVARAYLCLLYTSPSPRD